MSPDRPIPGSPEERMETLRALNTKRKLRKMWEAEKAAAAIAETTRHGKQRHAAEAALKVRPPNDFTFSKSWRAPREVKVPDPRRV